MNFNDLQTRVRRAELVVSVRSQQTLTQWSSLNALWKRSWTPGRIVVAGIATGFLAGKFEPRGKFTGARWLQMIGSLSSLMATAQAAAASAMAEYAAQSADEAAEQAGDAAEAATAAADATPAAAQGSPGAARPAAAPVQAPVQQTAAGLHAQDRSADGSGAAPSPAEAATELSER